MKSERYNKLFDKLQEVKNKLCECETIIINHSENGDITQTLKIKEVRNIIEIWLSLLIENY